ncbi:MAG TPA: hypothetical protein VL966_09985 [Alphaproteobacteria bacterium]|nr:hypothetical protein [Alphaproteobacteria bacterium]
MRPDPGVCPSCNRKIPRAAIRCVYCNTWLAVEILRAPGESAVSDPTVPSPATRAGAAYGSVIYLTPAEFAKLEYVATIARNPRTDALAEALVDKLACAVIVPARDLPAGVMTINRAARIVVSDGGVSRRRLVVLRNPESCDGDPGTVSVVSELGLALLGMTAGGSAIYRGFDGVSRTVTVERVLDGTEHAVLTGPIASPDGEDPGPTAA